MDILTLAVFILVYLGMMAGRVPRFAIDRTGIALLGAIVLVATGRIGLREAWMASDVSTLALLFGLMVVSAQLRLGGFYAAATRRIAEWPSTPRVFLAAVIALAGGLSALLANDIICLAMTPILIEVAARRRLDPMPYLMGLACAANIGSAATLIGNPQNMLIGEVLDLSFGRYFLIAALPSIAGLALTWWIILLATRGNWESRFDCAEADAPGFDLRQTLKGLLVLAAVTLAFVLGEWPRGVVALAGAGFLLLSRRLASRRMLGLIDGQLLVLFMALFVVNETMRASGMLDRGIAALAETGIDLYQPAWLFIVTVPLSNLVSNVPATMLLLPVATHPLAGPVLALSSTLAGNLLLVGSIANLIVADQAAGMGLRIGWRHHARIGIPVALSSLLFAGLWLLFIAWVMPGG